MKESKTQKIKRASADLDERISELLAAGPRLDGMRLSSTAFVFARYWSAFKSPLVFLASDNVQAEEITENLRFFLPSDAKNEVQHLPGVESDPYRGLSPHPDLAARRAEVLWQLVQGFKGILVTTPTALLTRLLNPGQYKALCLFVETGGFFPRDHLITTLRSMGYIREDPVSETGEFSFRGGIVDLFSPSSAYPIRLEFFGDEIESIREFDPSTQRSTRLIPDTNIVPMRELLASDTDISLWHQRAPEYWNEVRFAQSLEEKLQFTANRETFNGFEYLLPLVVDLQSSVFDFYAQSPELVMFQPETLRERIEKFWERMEASYQDADLEGFLALPLDRLFFSPDWMQQKASQIAGWTVEEVAEASEQTVHWDFKPVRRFQGRMPDLFQEVDDQLAAGRRLMFVMGSLGMAERMVDVFDQYSRSIHLVKDFEDGSEVNPSVAWGGVSRGFSSANLEITFISESEVFAEPQARPSHRVARREVSGVFLSDFKDLKVGDHVVHIDHGIGVFEGLKRITVHEDFREFLVLRYRGGDRLYVPVNNLDLVQKYAGGGQASPRVDRLGGTSWSRTKTRIKKSMRDLAEDLLDLYARREVAQGHVFSPDDELMREFEDAFQYTETPDQAGAIRDVKKDMESSRPMDRLICGDVGYGKTEVAMRAAFKAVNDGKQAVLLTPTTILALQHLNTFKERFKGFPVRVGMLSRFLSRTEQKQVLERVARAEIDILIGTHRLFSKDVTFSDLGLLIIDEEQRFGVAHKEKIKRMRAKLDVLTLSATPIPRTLNMSLIGVRDLSLIETAPKDRLAIQTVVVKFSRHIIRSAIDLELKRGGQVFFLHNSVDTIYSVATMLQEIMPEARVGVAHGQMPERQLEEVMLSFLNYEYDVLVCTTIIENGLDIPRANTLLVNRSDRFGLAQLYQLRGRVGRSNRRAYAYLLIPSEETLTTDARKRLAAIREFSDLGSGFRVAALDLEIRGAGNLLGGEQHGHISAVGFELYVKLLEQAVSDLKGEPGVEDLRTEIDLKIDIQIPKHYIPEEELRLWLYKRVSATSGLEDLSRLEEEVVDRFGRYPRSVSNLFGYARLRSMGRDLRITSIERKGNRVEFKFREDTPVSAEFIVSMLQELDGLTAKPDGSLALGPVESIPSRLFQEIEGFLERLIDSASVDA